MNQKIYDNKLYGCKSKRYLASFLSYTNEKDSLYVDISELRNVDLHFYSKCKFFYQSKLTGEKFSKRPSDYSTKKYREFSDASRKHKKILRRINLYLSRINTPKYLFSKKDYCYKDNASYHKGNTIFILGDIQSFFPNCKYKYVKDFFSKETGLNMVKKVKNSDGETLKYETDVAEIMAKLVTIPQKGKSKYDRIVPQGFPTSTLISFFSYKEMFDKIDLLAKKYDYKFSTYVDDITFSYNEEKIPYNDFINEINSILNEYGHTLNKNKIKYININKMKKITKIGYFPIITGIFLRRYKVQATPKLHKKMNRLFNKVNSAGPPRNTKQYLEKWSNYVSLVGVYNTINFIEPRTKSKRLIVKELIVKNANNFKINISIKRIKQLKWEDKLYVAYCSGTLTKFVNKYKDLLTEYKNNDNG